MDWLKYFALKKEVNLKDTIKLVIILVRVQFFKMMVGEVQGIIINIFSISVQAVTHLKVLILEKHDFWFIFGDGLGG